MYINLLPLCCQFITCTSHNAHSTYLFLSILIKWTLHFNFLHHVDTSFAYLHRVNLTIHHRQFKSWLGAEQATITWPNYDPVLWRIVYVPRWKSFLRHNEIHACLDQQTMYALKVFGPVFDHNKLQRNNGIVTLKKCKAILVLASRPFNILKNKYNTCNETV